MIKILTVKEVSKMLRVSTITVKRWLNSGKINGFRIGKRGDWRIKVEEVTKLLK